ncbi:MAG: hypothetical protein DWQ02_07320 [Bacteroidetes bacterium]|nr:MAG: hypothetical protein DWQ02_07320 [Bacteroidota bacterium]
MAEKIHFEEGLFGNEFMLEGFATANVEEFIPANKDDDYWKGVKSDPPTHISTDQDWQVNLKWTQKGPAVDLMDDELRWRVEILMEKIGIGEYELPDDVRVELVPFVKDRNHTYEVPMKVKARKVKREDEGLYKLYVIIQLISKEIPSGAPDNRHPVVGWVEFSKPIHFFED